MNSKIPHPRSIITLTTDFGPSSPYVAQMKGVILGIHPSVDLVDITHTVPPQQILAAAVILADSFRHFPTGSIHVAVVDPGVGTKRGIVLAKSDGHFFVAPDNGLLGLVARRWPPESIVRLEASKFWNSNISSTFHGRDIMAPVAAHLARGVEFEQFGAHQSDLHPLDYPDPIVGERSIQGMVLTVDAFGNVVTNVTAELLPGVVSEFSVQIDGQPPRSLPRVETYAQRERNALILLIGSNRRLEIAMVDGNAAKQLDVRLGGRINLEW